jgi:hypothetical protein
LIFIAKMHQLLQKIANFDSPNVCCRMKNPKKRDKFVVFISYRRKFNNDDDKNHGTEIARSIQTSFDLWLSKYTQSKCFFDQNTIPADRPFPDYIESAIKHAKVFVCVLTKDTLQSEFVRREIDLAEKYGKKTVFINYCNEFEYKQEGVNFVEHRSSQSLHNDTSYDATLKDLFYRYVYPELVPRVIVTSGIKYGVTCPGERLYFKRLDKDRLMITLPQKKGEYILYFKAQNNERDSFDFIVRVGDLDLTLKLDVEQMKKGKARKEMESPSLPSQGNFTANTKPRTATISTQATPCTSPSQTYKVGDYYDDGRMKGVVFDVTADGKHGKIVSLIESKIELEWAVTEVKDLFIKANNRTDGSNNMAKVMQIDNWRKKYPAFAWCADLGEGWYLPAIEELKDFTLDEQWHNDVNRTLYHNKGTTIAAEKDKYKYWSSTEENATNAEYIDIGEGYSKEGKTYACYVRAVAKF